MNGATVSKTEWFTMKEWLSTKELARVKGVSEQAVRIAIKRGYIKNFCAAKNANGKGRKGYLIHISDPYIKPQERQRYYEKALPAAGTSFDASLGPRPELEKGSSQVPGIYNKEEKTYPPGEAPKFSPATPKKEPPVSKDSKDCVYEFGVYHKAPKWQKTFADKYKQLIDSTEGLKGRELQEFIDHWNDQNPSYSTSYRNLLRMKRRYERYGIHGLLPGYGRRTGKTRIKPEWMDHFKYLYLKQGAPSSYSCWLQVRGKAFRDDPELDDFPSRQTFEYQLRHGKYKIPVDAIYFARYGFQAWDRKYGFSIDRDYSNIRCGEIWVSDHAQLDIAVLTDSGKAVFPWVTAWRDMKSGKWLGWLLHAEPPNSDHIFQSFYYAVKEYGIPEHIYIDNGKDYRCRDFAGGRRSYKLEVDEPSARNLVQYLGIRVHFALPYNASAKNIERDFLKIKEAFSKHMPGYRGGNTVERPEKLNEEIKTRRIMRLDELEQLFDGFVKTILNRAPSNGKVLRGMCPDELFEREAKLRVISSEEQLKVLCMRSSKNYTIGRNGVKDSEIGKTYYAPWMAGMIGTRVFLRRDPRAWQEALVFRAEDEEYLGRAEWAELYNAPAIQKTDIDRQKVRESIRYKKQQIKIAKSYIETGLEQSPQEKILNMAYGNEALNRERGYEGNGKPSDISEIELERLKSIEEYDRREQNFGKVDISKLVPPEPEKPRIFRSEAEKRIWEQEQQFRQAEEGP